jgi:hypothetical protein
MDTKVITTADGNTVSDGDDDSRGEEERKTQELGEDSLAGGDGCSSPLKRQKLDSQPTDVYSSIGVIDLS